MPEEKEIHELYNNLTEENKTIINMVAQGMMIAQTNKEIDTHIPRID